MKQQIIFSLTTVWPRDVGDDGPPELMRQDIGIEAPRSARQCRLHVRNILAETYHFNGVDRSRSRERGMGIRSRSIAKAEAARRIARDPITGPALTEGNRWKARVRGRDLRDVMGLRIFADKASAEAAIADELSRLT